MAHFREFFSLKYILGLEHPVSKSIYENFNHTTEKLTEFLNVGSIKVVCPSFMIPILIVNFYAYFTTDEMESYDFQMLFPYWYV